MKPLPTIPDPAISLASYSHVKIIRSARIKKMEKKSPPPPDEETLHRLNEMAKKFPFCILNREKDINLL